MRLSSKKQAQWEFGKYISENAKAGFIIRDILAELARKLEGMEFTAPHEGTASKLKKAYEVYVQKYGFGMSELEDISAFHLWQAHTELGIVKTKQEASTLINRLNSGEKFNDIRAEHGSAVKSRAEYLIEGMQARLTISKTPKGKGSRRVEVQNVVEEYHNLMKQCRDKPAKAERLLVDCFMEVATAYIES